MSTKCLHAAALIFGAFALLCASPGLSSAEPAATKAPAALEVMRANFASAVAAKDRAAVAKLSRFPLAIDGYGLPPKLTEFLRDNNHFEGLFFAGDVELVRCLKTQ